ncbi:MAG TPA: ABC transporter permease [Planctomycetota bacterium]|nr:ABC transporter permease [Planctomycetota bacterium]
MPWRLLLRNVRAHWLRSLLTFLSVAVAVFLVCVLQGAVRTLDASVQQAARNRLWVQSAVSLFVNLPLAYEGKIAAVDGVERVCRWQWFGGYFQSRDNFFAQFAVDPDDFLPSYPELEIVDGSYEGFTRNRTGCIVGEQLAEEFGWRVGSRVPIIGTIFQRADGAPWEFTIEAVYRARSPVLDQRTLFFDFDYLREALEQGAATGPPGAGVYLVALPPARDPTPVMAEIDALFAGGPQRVQTTTEAEFQRTFVTMFGNVGTLLTAISAGVVFAILFAVLNTMLLAARERTRDAGILKALGFTRGTVFGLLLSESMLLCLLGGAVGIGLALAVERGIQYAMAMMLPGFELGGATLALAGGLAAGVGLIAGVFPAWLLARVRPVDAKREA